VGTPVQLNHSSWKEEKKERLARSMLYEQWRQQNARTQSMYLKAEVIDKVLAFLVDSEMEVKAKLVAGENAFSC
jgi:hypothetical protein